jgi:hypothetical protein
MYGSKWLCHLKDSPDLLMVMPRLLFHLPLSTLLACTRPDFVLVLKTLRYKSPTFGTKLTDQFYDRLILLNSNFRNL